MTYDEDGFEILHPSEIASHRIYAEHGFNAGVVVDQESDTYAAIIGDTVLGSFLTRQEAAEALGQAQDYAAAMSGHYQRSCEDGSLLAWELENSDF